MTGPVTTGAGGKPVEESGTVAPTGEAVPSAGEPITDLIQRLGLIGTSNQVETIIRWLAERGDDLKL